MALYKQAVTVQQQAVGARPTSISVFLEVVVTLLKLKYKKNR